MKSKLKSLKSKKLMRKPACIKQAGFAVPIQG